MLELKIFWTPFALKSLEQIRDYIAKKSYSQKIANQYIQKLIQRLELLKKFPESGQEEELLAHLEQNIRFLTEGNYKIIYQYNDGKIIITDVFHSNQSPLKIIKRSKKK